MKKIPLILKRKYIAYCYQFISENPSKDYNMIYRAIGTLLKGSGIQDEENVAFEIDPVEFSRLWKGLGKRMETFTTRLHAEMRAVLEPQLMLLIQAEIDGVPVENFDAEVAQSVMYVLGEMQAVDAEVSAKNAEWVAEGNALIEA